MCSTRWISTPSSRAGRKLVLVDELAHTNAPGSRHPKRYLDVEELLAAGIDVYTTLNIQHVESLNDVVAQITRIPRARDRARRHPRPRRRYRGRRSLARRPDPAAEGGQGLCAAAGRARDAQLFPARQSDRAARARACAARRSASTSRCSPICARMPSAARGRRASACWSASARMPARPASCAMPGGWPTAARALDRDLCRDRALSAARRSGARPHRRCAAPRRAAGRRDGDDPGRGIADDVVAYAEDNNITQIVIGKSERSRWFEMLHGSVVHDLVRSAGNISVHVIAGEAGESEPAATGAAASVATRAAPEARSVALSRLDRHRRRRARRSAWRCSNSSASRNISLVFLTAVLVSAARYGLCAVALRLPLERARL